MRINAELLFMNAPNLTHGPTTYVITKHSTKKFFISQKLNCLLIQKKKKKKKRNPDLFTESSDSEIEISKVVPAGEPNNNNPTEINTKQEDVSEIQITKVIPANEQNSNSPTEIDIKEESIVENYTSNTRTLSETKPDVSRKASGKIYISEHYWEEGNPVFANNLPYDIDDKCVYVLPINKSKRFESAKDGRPWSNIRER